MFKFHELDRSVCLTCQYFKGKRKVEVIGRKMFIDFDKNNGNCRIFNDFPVIVNTRAGHCSWCHYKRWSQLPSVEEEKPPKPSTPQREKRGNAPRDAFQRSWGNAAKSASNETRRTASTSEASAEEEETNAPVSPRRGGCLWRLVKLVILAAVVYWLCRKFGLGDYLQPLGEWIRQLVRE